MKKAALMGAVYVLLNIISPGSNAAFIVDTGTPDVSNNWGFGINQYFAGQFSIDSPHIIGSVESYFSNVDSRFDSPAGLVEINLHLDDGSNGSTGPGSVLFSTQISMDANAPLDWYGVSALNWSLSAGTYWLSFIPDSSIDGIMPGSAPNPMDFYAQGGSGSFGDKVLGDDHLQIGFRIDANPVPLLPALYLFGSGLLGLAGMARRKSIQ